MRDYIVIFYLFGDNSYQTNVMGHCRNDAIKRARKQMRSSFFFSSSRIHSISAKRANYNVN